MKKNRMFAQANYTEWRYPSKQRPIDVSCTSWLLLTCSLYCKLFNQMNNWFKYYVRRRKANYFDFFTGMIFKEYEPKSEFFSRIRDPRQELQDKRVEFLRLASLLQLLTKQCLLSFSSAIELSRNECQIFIESASQLKRKKSTSKHTNSWTPNSQFVCYRYWVCVVKTLFHCFVF